MSSYCLRNCTERKDSDQPENLSAFNFFLICPSASEVEKTGQKTGPTGKTNGQMGEMHLHILTSKVYFTKEACIWLEQ